MQNLSGEYQFLQAGQLLIVCPTVIPSHFLLTGISDQILWQGAGGGLSPVPGSQSGSVSAPHASSCVRGLL